jgi:hypothetical protein
MSELLLIAGLNNPIVADLAAHAVEHGKHRPVVVSTPQVCPLAESRAESYTAEGFSPARFLAAHQGDAISAVIVFLSGSESEAERRLLDAVAEVAGNSPSARVCLVSTFRVHFGDRHAAGAEAYALERLKALRARTALFRPSHVLSRHSRPSAWLRVLAFACPLVPKRFKSCCLDGDELFAALEQEIDDTRSRGFRAYTLLGPNQPWKNLLTENQGVGVGHHALTALAAVMSLMLVGQILGLVFDLLVRAMPRLRSWDFDTLLPSSVRELLALYNRYNFRYVKIVGYNNGVVHFGHRHPGKTIVSTIRCNRVAWVNGRMAKLDGGVTVRQATEVLNSAGKEPYVVPNYSFVSMGTSFFVPIHGSASEYSTMGDTIIKVVLYDPAKDRFLVTTRGEPDFGHFMYNLECDILLLRLYIRTKEKSRYYLKQQTLANPTSKELLAAFHDERPSNVEVRKSKASSTTVRVYKYYTQASPGDSEALELPRDSVGRLWDRLEMNPLTSALFHGLTRQFAHHVELFFTADEFAVFWETHTRLPIAKIQLRYIKRDAMPHSPFRDHDCVSADLFMLKKHRPAFEAYVRQTFKQVRYNPGKHSM